MKVKDVMHKGVDWVSPDTPIAELAKLMRGHDIGCIPIGEDDQLIGMVTDRDIVCKGLASNNFDARRTMARDVMTEGIHCCREDDDLAKAVHHMEKLKLRRLPVICCPSASRAFRPITETRPALRSIAAKPHDQTLRRGRATPLSIMQQSH